jgi:uncharacterized protein (DUF111 family)
MAGGAGELCTPTGAALLATLVGEWGPVPRMRIDAVGVGAGSADPPQRANVLRVVLGVALAAVAAPWRKDDLFELEAVVDDLDPRLWPAVLDALVVAGAVDAWLTPVVMRKGRPGNVVTALVAGEAVGPSSSNRRRWVCACGRWPAGLCPATRSSSWLRAARSA